MTSRERLLAVLDGKIPDRVPISPRIWAWLLELYGKATFLEYLELGKKHFDYDPIMQINPEIPDYIYNQFQDYSLLDNVNVEMNIEKKDGKTFVRRIVKTPAGDCSDMMVYPPAGREYGIAPNPEKIEPLIKSEKDLDKVKWLLPEPKRFSLVNYNIIDDVIGENGMMEVRPHRGVDHLLVDSLGLVNSLLLCYDDKELFKNIITVFHDYYKECLIYCLENGAKMIMESWYNCSISAGWPPDVYREIFLPCIIEDAEITHSYGAYFHFYDDGNIMPMLEDYKKINMDLMSTLCPPPMGDVDPVIVKDVLGGVSGLTGFVDLSTIKFGKPDEIIEQVKYAIDILGKDGGYILGTSDSIRDGSPYENVKAFFDAGKKYGKY